MTAPAFRAVDQHTGDMVDLRQQVEDLTAQLAAARQQRDIAHADLEDMAKALRALRYRCDEQDAHIASLQSANSCLTELATALERERNQAERERDAARRESYDAKARSYGMHP